MDSNNETKSTEKEQLLAILPTSGKRERSPNRNEDEPVHKRQHRQDEVRLVLMLTFSLFPSTKAESLRAVSRAGRKTKESSQVLNQPLVSDISWKFYLNHSANLSTVGSWRWWIGNDSNHYIRIFWLEVFQTSPRAFQRFYRRQRRGLRPRRRPRNWSQR